MNRSGRLTSWPVSRPDLVQTIVLAIVLLLLWLARDALTPFLVGLFLAYALRPVVVWFTERSVVGTRIPRSFAILLVYLATVLLGLGLIRLIVPPLAEQVGLLVRSVPEYADRAQGLLTILQAWYSQLPLTPDLRSAIEARIEGLGSSVLEALQSFVLTAVRTTQRTLGFLFGFLTVPIWMFYALRDADNLGGTVLRLIPRSARATVVDLARITDRVLGRFIRGQLVLMAAVGAAVLLSSLLLGATVSPTVGRYAVLLSVIAGITEVLPVIGPIIGAIPAVALALLDGFGAAGWTIVAYIVIQQLENSLLVPKIVGDALDLNPAIIIVAIAVGTDLAGIAGAVFAAPLVALGREWVRYIQSRVSGQPGVESSANQPSR